MVRSPGPASGLPKPSSCKRAKGPVSSAAMFESLRCQRCGGARSRACLPSATLPGADDVSRRGYPLSPSDGLCKRATPHRALQHRWLDCGAACLDVARRVFSVNGVDACGLLLFGRQST
ncbi:hypothetical protein BDV59DRAFT_141010 [Aspergillus ambiguus]|uniref:uncharacterized protein n=1 Tax=Aspergillus ambiguus TaxID=176160 RepID=UPI003CCCE702